MKDIAGKTAVIIAGGNGIGRSIALALAREGANVVIADIQLPDAEAVVREAEGLNVRGLAIRCDASQLGDVEAVADAAYAAFGEVHILVNNAGVAVRPFRAIWDTSYADLQYMIGINVWGVTNGIHVFVPRMREQAGEKHMVNTSSMGALYKVPGNATYTMTKAAVCGMSEVIREELAPYDFGVTILYPGLINTAAAKDSGKLRSEADQNADSTVRPYSSYLAERGEGGGKDVGAGRGVVQLIGAGETSRPLEPEFVGPMVVQAIRDNRAYCMTHPAPTEGIMMRADGLLDGYRPLA